MTNEERGRMEFEQEIFDMLNDPSWNDWCSLLESILDDLIEYNNGGDDFGVYFITEKCFRLRELLKQDGKY